VDAGVEATVPACAPSTTARRCSAGRSAAGCCASTASTTQPPSTPGQRGEYHTVVTSYRGMPFVGCDPSTLPHVERDGIWALDWPATYMSDFH
jgi:hypothetical protein